MDQYNSKVWSVLTQPPNNVTVYTKANGLLNDQFNFSSAFKDQQGKMYFGSVKGTDQFSSRSI